MQLRFAALMAAAGVAGSGIVLSLVAIGGARAPARPEAPVGLQRIVLPVAPASNKAPSYLFSTVSIAGSRYSQISGINRTGVFTGNVIGPGGNRPFVDSGQPGAEPVFFRLPYPAVASTVQTAGIDTAGDVAGTYADRRGVFHGFVRTAHGTFRRLNIAGAGSAKGEGTQIAGMSPGGVIVGSFVTANKVATGFIDRSGHVTAVVERSAGIRPGEGTAVEFYSRLDGHGGVYFGTARSAHGWYTRGGHTHTVNFPAAHRQPGRAGTQLIGVDGNGRLYGIALTAGGTRSFSVLGGVFSAIRDPLQASGAKGETIVLGVNASGVIVGFCATQRGVRAFIGRPLG